MLSSTTMILFFSSNFFFLQLLSTTTEVNQDQQTVTLSIDIDCCLPYPSELNKGGHCRNNQQNASGILLSINETHPAPYLVKPLKLNTHRGDLDSSVLQYKRQKDKLGFSGKYQQIFLGDLYMKKATGSFDYASLSDVNLWPGDNNGNYTLWESVLHDLVYNSDAAKDPDVYLDLDVWNEPMAPNYFWNRSKEQFWETWDRAVRTVRGNDNSYSNLGTESNKKFRILGPSYAYFTLPLLKEFLDRCNQANTLPDVISWHEFDPPYASDPSIVVKNVQQVRQFLLQRNYDYYKNFKESDSTAGHPKLQRLPPISINEFTFRNDQFIPSNVLHYFIALEKSAVYSSCRACWEDNHCPPGVTPNSQGVCSTCGQRDHRFGKEKRLSGYMSLDGLITDGDGYESGDNVVGKQMPRALWWLYKGYGWLEGKLLQVSNESDTREVNLKGIATLTSTNIVPELRILIGGYAPWSTGPGKQINNFILRITNIWNSINSTNNSTSMSIMKIPYNTGRNPVSGSKDLIPTYLNDYEIDVAYDKEKKEYWVDLDIKDDRYHKLDFREGDVLLVVIGNKATQSIRDFAVDPEPAGDNNLRDETI